jgi:hypothetical protein
MLSLTDVAYLIGLFVIIITIIVGLLYAARFFLIIIRSIYEYQNRNSKEQTGRD